MCYCGDDWWLKAITAGPVPQHRDTSDRSDWSDPMNHDHREDIFVHCRFDQATTGIIPEGGTAEDAEDAEVRVTANQVSLVVLLWR